MSSLYLIMIMFSILIPLILFIIGSLFMENRINETGEIPFECGFEPISFSRIPFSMQFFSITIVFLIFDLEAVILLPLLIDSEKTSLSMLMMSLIIFILLMGLFVEWFDSSLEWSM
uniref:NADH-ubiquinone oxidoreductase chain 3 n=1 Tax=Franciscoloa roseicapillae TaxID=2965268 RepID=A0A9Y1YS71_9NEOP|nr:NADH dehydrogenase subunit 3 [Franciscoloa roseicapillae]WIM51551.1 NADH dehydrogenase subunit 3 [Franciscoloa roseicapillae]WIM51564.1 NADH dehydrogenase subunit 3 [Franciscoloa roseicapillae]WIM51587.1 NADH dehydrogenase subunit 3 [Franciscoloa roseicapillae]